MKWAILVALLLGIGCVRAEPVDDSGSYPTVAALAEAIIPARDRVDLAVRLRGLTTIPEAPPSAPILRIGDRETFTATNTSERGRIHIQATLRALGEHIALWVEDGTANAGVSDADLQALAARFDERVYPSARALWGSEAVPGVDGDPRVHGLFARNLGATTAAYFASDHTVPREVYPQSNMREMFFFNLDALGGAFPLDVIESVVAHEFQHMIRQNLQANEDTWLNEGMSQFTQFLLYNDLDNSAIHFLAQPNTQLTDWNADPALRAANYGAASLFMIYFYDRFGIEALQMLSAHPAARAWESVDVVARANGAASGDALFADWVMANLLHDREVEALPAGQAVPSYESLPPLITPLPVDEAQSLPFSAKSGLPPYATDYYLIPEPGMAARLSITLEAGTNAPLIDTGTGRAAGGHFLYSNRADLSDSRATRRFDLSGVDAADLDFRVWYDLETEWDYGYVMASRDGTTWALLTGESMTASDPNAVAYGTAYTGASGGWRQESISLDAYAGAPVWLRFEAITDDAVNRPGMAVDDVRIAALSTSEDFEAGDGGWLTEGWLWTDNCLPARFYVQTAAITPAGALVTRWETQGGGAWTFDLPAETRQVWIAVSPVAPVTTALLDYQLTVAEAS